MAVPVHQHTCSSFPVGGDGIATPDEIAQRVADLGMSGAFVTDHGTIEAFYDFSNAMQSRGLFAGFGIEAYQAKTHRLSRPEKKNARDQYHVILLAKNDEGLRNLNRLSDEAARTGFYYRPRIDWELLEKHHEGLICTSACLGGLIAEGIDNDDLSDLDRYLRIFKDDFFLEVHTYDHERQRHINQALVEIGKERGIPLVYANDAHMACDGDHDLHELMIAANRRESIYETKKGSYHPEDDAYYHPNCLYIMSEDEIRDSLSYLPESAVQEALDNSDLIGDQCKDVCLPKSRMHMPKYERSNDDRNTNQIFIDEVERGIIDRYGKDAPNEVWERAEKELEAIIDADLSAYFLIKQDLIQWCESENILVGPGRGSAAGSILAYVLRITNICPLKYGLQFERFWNPGRAKGFPDIDIDVEQGHRQRVKKYLAARWGEERVISIGTKNTFHPKGALRLVAPALYGKNNPDGISVPYADLGKISDIIDELNDAGFDATWDEIWEKRGEAMQEYVSRYPAMFEAAQEITGRTSGYSIHASAIIISDVDLPELLPGRMAARKGDDGSSAKELVTQVDMHTCERLGFLKADVLGLRNLDTLHLTAELAGEPEFRYRDIDLDNLPDEMWQLIDDKKTLGLFQIEEGGAARRIAKNIRPRSIDDLAAIVALNRPGPLRSGAADSFINRRNGTESVEYPHEMLEDILKDTYGLMIYQEQIISYFRAIGYSMSDADHMRKIIGKKLREEMDAEYPNYMEKALQHMDEEQADNIWGLIEEFSKYGFNKSHAVAYGVVLAWTMYAKWKWPTEFIMASIKTNSKKAGKYVSEGRRIGVEILPPCVNNSKTQISKKDGKIYFGLRDIKGIGETTAKWIIDHGPYESYNHFLDVYDEAIDLHNEKKASYKEEGKKVRSPGQIVGSHRIQALHDAGAFDNIYEREEDLFTKAALQEELLGLALIDPFIDLKQKYADILEELDDVSLIDDGEPGDYIQIPAIVKEIRKTKTKSGRNPGSEMAIIKAEWEENDVSFAIFSGKWLEVRHFLRRNTMGKFTLKLSERGASLEEVMRFD